jgi:hypothetical protein
VPLLKEILHQHATHDDVVAAIVDEYEAIGCDGVFLPAVSHLGIRLPVDTICAALARVRPPRFVVVDGAQALCHVPSQVGLAHCDFFLTGCHKWLQGHVPMGVAFCPREESAPMIASRSYTLRLLGDIDDPLLAFTSQLEEDSVEMFSETVNLSSLFSCRAAVADRSPNESSFERELAQRIANADKLAQCVSDVGWQPLVPRHEFRSGVLLLRPEREQLRHVDSQQLRAFFLAHGIALSTYEEGLIRLSMPARPWRDAELDLICWALRWWTHEDDSRTRSADSFGKDLTDYATRVAAL